MTKEGSGLFEDSNELARRIREDALIATSSAKAAHVASALSVADIVAVLYGRILNVDPADPEMENRDRFILSKGHAGVAIYSALAETGFFSRNDFLENYYQDGSHFSGHISHKEIPGVEVSTGSLGHGLGIACGFALDAKLRNLSSHVFTILGDGECEEGSVWEAALFAKQFALDNLTVIVDRNNQQSFGHCDETAIDLGDLGAKFAAFGWHVDNVDGHDHNELEEALAKRIYNAPSCVIAHTIKGKGVPFMEDDVQWHYKDVQGELLDEALRAIREVQCAKQSSRK